MTFGSAAISILCCFGDYYTTDIEVHEVAVFENQYSLQCGDRSDVNVQWFYQEELGDTPVPIAELGDTSYITSPPDLYLTYILSCHEGFYSCNQVTTVYHLVVFGEWNRMHIVHLYYMCGVVLLQGFNH